MASRTATAPLDRLKIYLIAQTSPTRKVSSLLTTGSPIQASMAVLRPLRDACVSVWTAGGVYSLWAGRSSTSIFSVVMLLIPLEAMD